MNASREKAKSKKQLINKYPELVTTEEKSYRKGGGAWKENLANKKEGN